MALFLNWATGMVDYVDNVRVTPAHEKAIAYVAGLAGGGPGDPAWRVTLHFHPDRLVGGVPILRRMADDGVYRSQFETGMVSGSSATANRCP